jgi:hypothetical protein
LFIQGGARLFGRWMRHLDFRIQEGFGELSFKFGVFSALLLARVHRKMEARESLRLVSQRKEHTRRGKNFNALKWRRW